MPQKQMQTGAEAPPEQPGAEAPPELPQPPQPEGEHKSPTPPKGAKEELYDKIPLSYKQVDILVKVLLALLAVLVIVGVITGSGIGF